MMREHDSQRGYYKLRTLAKLNELYLNADWEQLARWLVYFCDNLSEPYVEYYWRV